MMGLRTRLDMKACRSLASGSVTCRCSSTAVCGPCGSEQPATTDPTCAQQGLRPAGVSSSRRVDTAAAALTLLYAVVQPSLSGSLSALDCRSVRCASRLAEGF